MNEFDWVYENEYFIPGHEYQVCVYLKTVKSSMIGYTQVSVRETILSLGGWRF